ncbi:MAG: pyridoxamine 5'-phosphate oxidase family protein [Prevotellaceae bacterium]|nr:pyridoxamine 5'-phosphate oxidase family protein [Prevotellaceae bacterium]
MKYDNSEVRRRDRLLKEEAAIELLKSGEYGYLSMTREDRTAYGIPISYAWNEDNSIYLHCAPVGTKLKCLSCNAEVSFCVVGKTHVISDKFTTEYESIIMQCTAHTGLSDEEKHHALELILDKYSPNDKEIGLKYAEKSFHRTEIIRLDINSCSGKCKTIRQ